MVAIGDSDHNLMLGIPLVMAIVVEDSSWPTNTDSQFHVGMTIKYPIQ